MKGQLNVVAVAAVDGGGDDQGALVEVAVGTVVQAG